MKVIEWFRNKVQYDADGGIVWAVEEKSDGNYLHHVADVRGWGEMQNLFKLDMDKAAKFQDEVGQFITDAINEKLEREKP